MHELDAINSRKLFGNSKTGYGIYKNPYLYSIERPIMDFFPITVIQMFGVAERPLILVLYDEKGKYINAIEVADFYGETGGCLNSFFINDSTLIREYEWLEPDDKDEIATTYRKEKVIIHKNGTYTVINKNSETENHKTDNAVVTKQTNNKLDNLKYFKINNGKDTIVDLDYFTSENFANLKFNYPKLKNSKLTHPWSSFDTNILKVKNDNIKIVIKQIKYNVNKHNFKEDVEKSIVLIDGVRFYGFDLGTRETEINGEIE